MFSQKNTEEDVISETVKADKVCKNMVLHKEIADGQASSSNKEQVCKETQTYLVIVLTEIITSLHHY